MSGAAAALLGVAALVVPAVPADAATGGTTPPPTPGELIPGQRTATPALVEGIREPAPDAPNAVGAARAHLAEQRGRYRIANPERDLEPAGTVTTDGGHEIVRLRQEHRGVPVLGGQYVVRMEKRDGERVVTGTSGRYFTGLRTGTTAEVDDALAVERAVDAVRSELGAQDFTAYAEDGAEDATPFTGTSHGLVVLPTGTGVLTRHVTVRGEHPAGGEPVLREVYVDAEVAIRSSSTAVSRRSARPERPREQLRARPPGRPSRGTRPTVPPGGPTRRAPASSWTAGPWAWRSPSTRRVAPTSCATGPGPTRRPAAPSSPPGTRAAGRSPTW